MTARIAPGGPPIAKELRAHLCGFRANMDCGKARFDPETAQRARSSNPAMGFALVNDAVTGCWPPSAITTSISGLSTHAVT